MNEKIGPYRLEEQIGRGGMGEVYRAYDERLDRKVAVKHVRPDRTGDETIRRRLRREAKAAASLGHPNIVQVFDILETEDGDWIVMELVEGETISEMIAQAPLDLATGLKVGKEVASALAYAHGKGFIHRDLKTENVMLSPVSGSKILDFGLAKRVLDSFGGEAGESMTLTEEGKLIGTARALSPEQARGYEATSASDLFAFGVFLYECFTAISPFRGDNPLATLNKVYTLRQDPISQLRPEIPEEVSQLVDQLLEKLPERRPRSAEQTAERLAEMLRWEESGSHSGASRSAAALTTAATPATTADTGTLPHGPVDPPPASTAPRRLAVLFGASALIFLVSALFWLRSSDLGTEPPPPVSEETVSFDQEDAWALYEQGRAELKRHYRPGAVERAIEDFQKAIVLEPERAASYSGLAAALHLQYFNKLDPIWLDRARQTALRAVEADPHLTDAQITSAAIQISFGELDSARKSLEKILRLNPNSAEAHFRFAQLLEEEGDFDAAQKALETAIELDSSKWVYASTLTGLAMNSGKYEIAEQAGRLAVKLSPDNAYVYRNLAAVVSLQGKPREGIDLIQRSLEIQPTSMAYSNLGTLYFQLGLYQDAVAPFEKAVETGANNYQRWSNLGDAYRWTPENQKKAEDAYLRAAQLLEKRISEKPGDALLLSRFALLLSKQNRHEQSLEVIEGLDPSGLNASMWYRIAVAHEISNRREEALSALGKALEAGFSPAEADRDPELLRLRESPRYHRLVAPILAAQAPKTP